MFDVVGLGENSVDLVFRAPSFPQPEGARSKMSLTGRHVSCGGRVATTLAACARLGWRAAYLGATGNDVHGHTLRTRLASFGVDVSRVLVREAPTRIAVVVVADDSGERAVLWERDERLAVRPEELPWELIRGARLLHLDDEDEGASVAAARAAVAAGVRVTSDFDRLTPRTEELFGLVDYPIVAEGLLSPMTGLDDPERALRKLRARHAGLLCVTLGRRGAAALDGDRFVVAPGFAVETVDATGAGDVFRAGFIDGLLRGLTVEALLRFANATAAASCRRAGAMDAVPARPEIEQLLSGRLSEGG